MVVENHPFQFVRGHDAVFCSHPHVGDAVKEVRLIHPLRNRDNDQGLSLFIHNPDIRRDLRLYPGGDLLRESAERVVGRINTYNGSGVRPAERNDAPMMIEKPTDRFERWFEEGERFLEFHRVGFMDGHATVAPQ